MHGAHRVSGEQLQPGLSHVLEGMGKSFGLLSVPSECPRAGSMPSPCQEGAACRSGQLCLSNGRGKSCLCSRKATFEMQADKAQECVDVILR